MRYREAVKKVVICKKCKIRMLFKRTWDDDGHGHAGHCSYYKCPKCDNIKFVQLKEDEDYSYASF